MEHLFALPNGLSISGMSRFETRVLYHEVFESDAYWKHGLRLRPGEIVLDVGANIGMFALGVAARFPGVVVHAFEPMPRVYEALVENARRCDLARIETHAHGLSKALGVETFTFDPNFTFAASSHLEELARLLRGRASLRDWREAVVEDLRITGVYGNGALSPLLRTAVTNTPASMLVAGAMTIRRALAVQKVMAPVKTLASVVKELSVPGIGLLKVDVEGAELDVLHGLDAESWPLIHRVVAEVHDVDGRVERIRDLMESHGLEVLVEQEPRPLKKLLSMYLVYGHRS